MNHRRTVHTPDVLQAYAKCKRRENNNRVDEMSAKLLAYYRDDDKKPRRIMSLCRYHYYIQTSRIGGSAMTTVNCRSCDREMLFGSTCTDEFCIDCATKHQVCRHCGGKLE